MVNTQRKQTNSTKFVTHLWSTHKENKQTAQRKQIKIHGQQTHTYTHTQLSPKSVDLEPF